MRTKIINRIVRQLINVKLVYENNGLTKLAERRNEEIKELLALKIKIKGEK